MPQTISGMMTMTASSLGPTIGGYITDAASWHWLFLVNLIPGTICALSAWALVDLDRPRPEMLKRMDLWGLLFMACFLGERWNSRWTTARATTGSPRTASPCAPSWRWSAASASSGAP